MEMSLADIQQKIGELDALRAALANKAASATSQDKIKALEEAQPMIKPKTKAMEALLMAGYNMTIATAKSIIAERDKNPVTWPLERYEQAKAMLEAYAATAQVISTKPGWHRTGHH